jgi:hypothetical protein
MKFDEFDNVSITGIDVNTLDDEQLAGFAAWRPEFEMA